MRAQTVMAAVVVALVGAGQAWGYYSVSALGYDYLLPNGSMSDSSILISPIGAGENVTPDGNYAIRVTADINDSLSLQSGSAFWLGYTGNPTVEVEFYHTAVSTDFDGDIVTAGATVTAELMVWSWWEATQGDLFIRFLDSGGAVLSENLTDYTAPDGGSPYGWGALGFAGVGPISAVAPAGAVSFEMGYRATTVVDGGQSKIFADNFIADITPIPEPATLALLALGGVLVTVRRRRTA